jgi:gliding motility-associated-like protein
MVLCAAFAGGLSGLAVTPAQAQNYCSNPPSATEKGNFGVNAWRGCAPFTVAVTPGAGLASDTYIYDYKGNGLPTGTAQRSFVYTQPGSYTILQIASKSATGAVACEVIEVMPTSPIPFTTQSCSGRQVTVQFQLAGQTLAYERVLVNWGDGVEEQLTPTANGGITNRRHTYGSSGQFTVQIRGIYLNMACQGQSSSQNVTVAAGGALSAPIISQLTVRSASNISINYLPATNTRVRLYQKDDATGIYQPTSLSSTVSTEFVINTDASRVQCFQVVAEDGCGAQQPSDEVCSLILNAQAQDQKNNLTWSPYAGTGAFGQYRISRNNAPIAIGNATNRNTASYLDATGIQCGAQYCYTLSAIAGPTTITSAPVCVTGLNLTPPGPFQLVYPSVEEPNEVWVQTVLPTISTTPRYTVQVLRANAVGGPFQSVGELQNTNLYIDKNVNPSAQSYCYQLVYKNACGLSSAPSEPVCSVWLTSKTPNGIDWTAESPFAPGGGLSYGIEILDTEFNTTRFVDLGGITHYDPDLTDPRLQVQRFRIVAFSNGRQSKSNYYEFRQEPRLYVPTAFTPNGDTENNTFDIRGAFLDTFEMNVYNRWGEVVYSTKTPSPGWDGTVNGTPLPTGYYSYRISVIDLSGQPVVKTGSVLLLR